MGNDNKKGKKSNVAPPVKPIEIKTYVMSCQSKMSLYRNKKVYEIKKKKDLLPGIARWGGYICLIFALSPLR